MKEAVLILVTLFSFFSARAFYPINGFKYTNQSDKEVNKKDDLGRKQGPWVVYGKDRPAKGYPTNGKVEEGSYNDNRKQGFWTKYFSDGKTPRLIGEFDKGRPRGQYTKMYTNGKVREKGTFINGKQQGTYQTFHKNGKIAQEKTFNRNGLEEGVQKYFYPNGQIEFEFTKTNGTTKGTATRYTEDGQVKEIIKYDAGGKIISHESKKITTKPKTVVSGAGGPSGKVGNMRGKEFDKDGYNKVYNSDEELWLDGKFKNGKLWDGKLYKYDSDGILLKIEVWKNGKYHSDGQL